MNVFIIKRSSALFLDKLFWLVRKLNIVLTTCFVVQDLICTMSKKKRECDENIIKVAQNGERMFELKTKPLRIV